MGRLTISNTATLWSPADHSGTLYKRVGGCRPGWRKRFFVLKGSALFYFNDAESFSPRGVIPIELASVTAGQRVQGMLDRRDKYIISVTVHSSFECSKAVYLLSARSTHSQQRWIEALQAVTTPVADLAARASQIDPAVLEKSQASYSESDAEADDDEDGEFGGSDNDEPVSEVSLTPRVSSPRKAAADPPQQVSLTQSASKKGIRFAEGTPEAPEQSAKVKKVQRPFANIKDSVYISGNSFDFHGTPLEDEDVMSLAEQDSDAQPGVAFVGGDSYPQQVAGQDWSSSMGPGYGPDEHAAPGFRGAGPSAHSSATYSSASTAQPHGQPMHSFTSIGSPVSPQTPSAASQVYHSSPHSSTGPQQVTYQQQFFEQQPQPDPRGASAPSIAPMDWSGSGVFRPSTFYPQQQQQPPAPAPAPPNLPTKPHHRASSSLQLETISESRGPAQRAPAESIAPLDWSTQGAPRVTEFVASGHVPRPSAVQYSQGGYAPESPPASRGQSPEPPQSVMPAPAVDAPRPSAGSGYTYGGGGPAPLGPPGAGHDRSQSLVQADWSTGGLPRMSSNNPVGAARLSSIPEGGSPQGGPTGAGPPGVQSLAPHQHPGFAVAMPYVGDVAKGGAGGMSRGAAQSMPPSQWGRSSAGPGPLYGAQGAAPAAAARGGAASMFVGSPQQAVSLAPLDLEQYGPTSPVQAHSPPASPPPPPPPPQQVHAPSDSVSMPPGPAGTLNYTWDAAPGAAPESRGRSAWQRLAQGPVEAPAAADAGAAAAEEAPLESGSSINEITRSLEHLRSTVANMQESLRRSPEEGSRSPSPEQTRAADALARARHVLRTVESRRNPRGRAAGGGHSRSNTFDVADLSASPELRADSPGLARMATIDGPSGSRVYDGHSGSRVYGPNAPLLPSQAIFSDEAPVPVPAGQLTGGGGQNLRYDGLGGGAAGGYAQLAADSVKRGSAAAAGYGENQAGMIGAQRASQGTGRSSDAYFIAPPQL